MFKQDYLEKKKEQLEQKKRYHASYLKAYETSLFERNDSQKEEKLKKKAKHFKHQEERFEAHAIAKNNALKKRIWEIDFLRAIVIFGMLIDHFIQDFTMFFPKIFSYDDYWGNSFLYNANMNASVYTSSDFRWILRFIGIITLAILIGINTHFSKSNWKRFFVLFVFGTAINLFYAVCATKGVLDITIMNIIMAYALSMLLYCICESAFKRFKKAWKWICLGIALVIFVSWGFVRYNTLNGLAAPLDNTFFAIFNNASSRIDSISCEFSELTFSNWLEIIVGIRKFGTEWIGLFPIVGYVFLGSFIAQTVYKNKKSLLCHFDKEGEISTNEKFNRATSPFLFFGHHTILIYIFHQPVYTILAWIIIGLFMGIPPIF